LIAVCNSCKFASARAIVVYSGAQIYDSAQLSITVGLTVLFNNDLMCALLVHLDPVAHHAFDVLLDTIINYYVIICEASIDLLWLLPLFDL
jgi:hypothetical protein